MHVVVVGNGIAGSTAARTVRRLRPDWAVTMVSDESDHPYARTALMYAYMGVLTRAHTKLYEDRFWDENRIARVRDRVERVEPAEKRLVLRDGPPLAYDRLLIASGSVPAFYDWPGQDLDGVQGLYGLPDLDRMEAQTRGVSRAVVVGGGLIGVELAEMLRTRGIAVTMLVREATYLALVLPPEEGRLVEAEIRRHGVDLRMETELREILPDDEGRAHAVVTTAGEEIPAAFVGIATGVRPNVTFLGGSGIETGFGVLVDDHFRTNVPDVFAAGDCAEFRQPPPGRRAVEQLWYTGREHGATVAHGLVGTPRPYRPGVFFNSAKFFDLEWQQYGRVDPVPPEGETTIQRQSPDERRLLRIQHEAGGERAVVGFNALGVRQRHAVCAHWIETRMPVETVLERLASANFDPEFARAAEGSLVAEYNATHGVRLAPTARRGWGSWMARLPMGGTTAHSLRDAFRPAP